jgi:Ca2+-binding RTX toxin-like protein
VVNRSLSLSKLLVLASLALVALVLSGRISTSAAASSELFFSEYVEGSSNNKALEIYNGTGAPVTLTGVYDVQVFANGSPTATATVPLTGTIADGDVFVLARESAVAAVLAQADQVTTNFLFNGNDAVALRRSGAIVDVLGQIGSDPGTEWGSRDASTVDNTLRRKATVQAGDTNGGDAFDPALEWDGLPLDTFSGLGTHSVSGGGGGGTNAAPDAVADSAVVDEDGGETAIDVLANDTDADGDSLTITTATDAANGAVSIEGSAVVYTPDVDFNGQDSFTYTISDGHGGLDTASVSVTVEPVNDDPDVEDDAAATSEDAAVTIDVLGNDADPDGDALVVSSAEGALEGAVTVGAGGTSVTYSPALDFNGVDTFEYAVSDGNEGVEIGEVVVTVTPVNDPPRATADSARVAAGGSAVVDVLANDSPGPADESSQTLTVASVGSAAHGLTELILTGAAAGKVRYTPASGYRGSDSFTYVVSDGGATATGAVGVSVTAPRLKTICGLTPTIAGTRRADVIEGTTGDDVIRAGRGNDTVNGNGGNDIVCAGPGADQVTTQAGEDRILGGSGADTIDSGAGPDRLRGGFGADTIAAGAGNDAVAAGPGSDVVDAGDGRNTVTGGLGDDGLVSGAGPDRLDGGPGTDTCDADGGTNTLLRCE